MPKKATVKRRGRPPKVEQEEQKIESTSEIEEEKPQEVAPESQPEATPQPEKMPENQIVVATSEKITVAIQVIEPVSTLQNAAKPPESEIMEGQQNTGWIDKISRPFNSALDNIDNAVAQKKPTPISTIAALSSIDRQMAEFEMELNTLLGQREHVFADLEEHPDGVSRFVVWTSKIAGVARRNQQFTRKVYDAGLAARQYQERNRQAIAIAKEEFYKE